MNLVNMCSPYAIKTPTETRRKMRRLQGLGDEISCRKNECFIKNYLT